MGENIQITNSHQHRKVRHKCERMRLPTPPPDPVVAEEEDKEKERDFLNYLDSLQTATSQPGLARSASIFSPAIAAEDAFDHLDKLYKLMDQMLLLREQNARLHRRIRDLEHLSNLQKLQKQLEISTSEGDLAEWEKDAAFAETVFENILRDAKFNKQTVPSRLRQSILRRQRNRSASMALERPYHSSENERSKQTSRRTSEVIQNEDGVKPSKVSKWTKVKAAFKWEKASPTVGDSKMHDSGIGGMLPVNLEVARYLRVPSTSEDAGVSPADSGAAEISTPGSISNASSMDDFSRKDFHSSDDEQHQYFHHDYIPQNKDEHSSYSKLASNKIHRTPWAKMKDIIHTRNSFKTKHRLSARSDDTRIEEHGYSENEEVFEDDTCSRISPMSPSPTTEVQIPPEVIVRYQQAVAEDESADKNNLGAKSASKWTRVKKAFLTGSSEAVRKKNEISSKTEATKRIQEEINRNYKELQKKLSLEFQDKLQEWDKHKSGISSSSTTAASSSYMIEENQDPAFLKKMEEWERKKSQPTKRRQDLQLQCEENLPPEFRKKLQQWQRIKKGSTKEEPSKKKIGEWPRWKSVTSHKSDDSHSEHPQLSDEFLKKLETWKQIKASGGPFYNDDVDSRKSKDNKTPSPGLIRKNSPAKSGKKGKDQDKELQWFEKELGKIEKEKQRLERERQKFLEREERLTKLRRSVMGTNKKEVLVHTQSGFYRFEGISRKFTQKLYEWEKAQGITPEESTFALLNSCYPPEIRPTITKTTSATLVRSKSADSIVTSGLNLNAPLISHQPSSLSLNDVEDLEKECLTDSKGSSSQYVELNVEEEEEPEALIVEVEDIIEETAAPLENYLEKQQTPIYQHEGIKSMCAGEACLGPKVRRSESVRAQTNYNLIEESVALIKLIINNEDEILRIEQNLDNTADSTGSTSSKSPNLNGYYENQKFNVTRLADKLTRLLEANLQVTSSMDKDNSDYNPTHVAEVVDAIQDLSTELSQMAEKLDNEISNRSSAEIKKTAVSSNISQIVKQLNGKILELRRLLSYICAASDMTAPRKKKLPGKKGSKQTPKESADKEKETGKYIKSETSNLQSQGAIKKRIRYRQKSLQNKIPDESDEDEDDENERANNKHKKLTRTRSITDNYTGFSKSIQKDSDNSDKEDILVDPEVVQKVVVPTETNIVTVSNTQKPTDSPVSIFVKTTRKLFTPIGERSAQTQESSPAPNSPKTEHTKTTSPESDKTTVISTKEVPSATVSRLPPLPASPTPQRKLSKDISPNIRIMLARYNQKISEQEATSVKSGGSSGSNSPVAWRSPIAERRVKAQTERYQQEVEKLSPLIGVRKEVQKSASVGILHPGNKQVTVIKEPERQVQKGLSKSSSESVITSNENKPMEKEKKKEELKLSIYKPDDSASPSKPSPQLRSRKLQKAKEDFLNSGCSSAPVTSQTKDDSSIKFPTRNRLSQISVGSESSCDSSTYEGLLIKSASAGMINIDADTYRKIDPEIHREGYVSLPRNCMKPKQGFLGNIASKFRKIKMRRGRDRNANKMNTISALCRQSLVVDINKSSAEEIHQQGQRRRSNEEAKESYKTY